MDNDVVSSSAVRLGDLERDVMEQLWNAADGATVREVHTALEADREIAYTTVMTVLDRLAKKSLVTREREGRAWRYAAASSREALSAQAMRHTVDRLVVQVDEAALTDLIRSAVALNTSSRRR